MKMCKQCEIKPGIICAVLMYVQYITTDITGCQGKG